MSGIVCAIRGGPHSQSTIDRAIALSAETGLDLVFLYIVNLDFLEHTSSSRTQAITHDMEQMGEFILLVAQTSAEASGVKAKGVVRHGNVSKEIALLCHEIEAEYLVVGQPRLQTKQSVFTEELLAEFVRRIEDQTGSKVILSEED